MRLIVGSVILLVGCIDSSDPLFETFTLWEDIGLPEDLYAPESSLELVNILIHEDGLYPNKTSRNRVIATPVSDELSFRSTFIRQRMIEQRALDEANDAFTPDLATDTRYEETPMGRITLGQVIRRSVLFVDFAILEFPELMIRYSHDCNGMPFTHELHPLLKEFFVGTEAHNAALGPKYFFVSPPAALSLKRPRKLAFAIDDSLYTSCYFAEGTVRYAILQPTQMSLRSYIESEPGGQMEFWYAMELGRTLIQMIEVLHSRGFVHGDFSIDNVRVDEIEEDDSSVLLSLTGFAFASEIDPAGFAIDPSIKDPAKVWAVGYSPRELSGNHTYGKQDDVFRIVETVAAITQNITEYRSGVLEKWANGTLMSWKSNGFLFGDISEVGLPVRNDVRTRIEQILDLVRRDDVIPDYENISRLFSEVSELTRPFVASSTSPAPLVLEPVIAAMDNVHIATPSQATVATPSNQENQRPSKKRTRDFTTL